MRISLLLASLSIIWALVACEDNTTTDPEETVDVEVQQQIDSALIAEYVAKKGYSNIDTTASGVYFILLDSGNGSSIKPNDIVTFNYIGLLTNDTIFHSNIESVAEAAGVRDTLNLITYNPVIYTHTTDGWNIPPIYTIEYWSLESGYREGVTLAMNKLKIGGKGRIIIPSTLAYKSSIPWFFDIPDYAILIFDIYPTYVR